MSRLLEIATELGRLSKEGADLQIRTDHLKSDEESRILYITPEGGWIGKNPDERKASESKALSSDSVITSIRNQLIDLKDGLSFIRASESMLEDERRALEWEIRDAYVKAIGGRFETDILSMPDPTECGIDNMINRHPKAGTNKRRKLWKRSQRVPPRYY
jgi:hypothetical protein